MCGAYFHTSVYDFVVVVVGVCVGGGVKGTLSSKALYACIKLPFKIHTSIWYVIKIYICVRQAVSLRS
jgi:hypothetical protein